jgi:hypothetical protein
MAQFGNLSVFTRQVSVILVPQEIARPARKNAGASG